MSSHHHHHHHNHNQHRFRSPQAPATSSASMGGPVINGSRQHDIRDVYASVSKAFAYANDRFLHNHVQVSTREPPLAATTLHHTRSHNNNNNVYKINEASKTSASDSDYLYKLLKFYKLEQYMSDLATVAATERNNGGGGGVSSVMSLVHLDSTYLDAINMSPYDRKRFAKLKQFILSLHPPSQQQQQQHSSSPRHHRSSPLSYSSPSLYHHHHHPPHYHPTMADGLNRRIDMHVGLTIANTRQRHLQPHVFAHVSEDEDEDDREDFETAAATATATAAAAVAGNITRRTPSTHNQLSSRNAPRAGSKHSTTPTPPPTTTKSAPTSSRTTPKKPTASTSSLKPTSLATNKGARSTSSQHNNNAAKCVSARLLPVSKIDVGVSSNNHGVPPLQIKSLGGGAATARSPAANNGFIRTKQHQHQQQQRSNRSSSNPRHVRAATARSSTPATTTSKTTVTSTTQHAEGFVSSHASSSSAAAAASAEIFVCARKRPVLDGENGDCVRVMYEENEETSDDEQSSRGVENMPFGGGSTTRLTGICVNENKSALDGTPFIQEVASPLNHIYFVVVSTKT